MNMKLKFEPVANVKALTANMRIASWNGQRAFPALLEQFRATCRHLLPCVGAAMERNDCDLAAHSLQYLAGASHLVGASRLEAMCNELRHLCLEGVVPEDGDWAVLAQAVGDYLDVAQTWLSLSDNWSG